MNLIYPDKYTNIDSCLLVKTSSIIRILKKHPKISIHHLYNELKQIHLYVTDKEFLFALDILFCFQKIKYYLESDEIGLYHDN